MIRFLALAESAAICAAVWGAVVLLSAGPGAAPYAIGPALAVALCTIVSFYYNDLYDLGAARTPVAVAARLPQALAIMLVLWAGLQPIWPALGVPMGPSLAGVGAVCGAVLGSRTA